MSNLQLSLACSNNPRTRPIIDGRVKPDGIDLQVTPLGASEMFWRQLHFEEFDVSEMSMSSLIIAVANGDRRFVGIPIFTSRRFFHTGVLIRNDVGIEQPGDLRDKRVGVPEYQQTAALWARAALQDMYGLRAQDMSWYMERTPELSHGGATGFQPPPGLRFQYIPMEKNIGGMLQSGELDATIMYISGNNLVDRSSADLSRDNRIRRLFPDQRAAGIEYYEKTGLYPINHGFVVRRAVFEKEPWVVLNLFNAFTKAKEIAMTEAREYTSPYVDTGLIQGGTETDLFPYGAHSNSKVLTAIARFSNEQGLTPRVVGMEEIFAPQTLEL